MPWETEKEKLLCMMVLDDDVAAQLSREAGPAFWRGFIVQDRATGQIFAKFRYRYANGERNWYEIQPHQQNDQTMLTLRCKLEDSLVGIAGHLHIDLSRAIKCFYPPDDEGDPTRILSWLEERDLIEIKFAKKKPKG